MTLLAYQIAFNLAENENQAFLLNVQNHLDALSSHASAHVDPNSGSAVPSNQTNAATEPSGDVQMRDDINMPNGLGVPVHFGNDLDMWLLILQLGWTCGNDLDT
jgi:26S proteasome regulatory subunit N2